MEQDKTSRLITRLTIFIRRLGICSVCLFFPYAFTTGTIHKFASVFGLLGTIGILLLLFLLGALSGLECYQALRSPQRHSFSELIGIVLFHLVFGTTNVYVAVALILYLIKSFRRAGA